MSDTAEQFMKEMEEMIGWLRVLVESLDTIELTLRQKSQIAGMIMGITTSFVKMNQKLVEWGYLPREERK